MNVKYNSEYHDNWAWSLAMKGATDQEIATAMGISKRTVERWKKDHESFAKALEVGKESADATVEKTLYMKATGFDVKDVEQFIDRDPATGEVVSCKEKVFVKHMPPDTMAIMYWLNNRTRKTGEWTQRQEVQLSGGVANVDLGKLSDEDLVALAKYAKEERYDGDDKPSDT